MYNSSLRKISIREGLEYEPNIYRKGTKRIKDKRICFALQFDLTTFAVDQATGLARERSK